MNLNIGMQNIGKVVDAFNSIGCVYAYVWDYVVLDDNVRPEIMAIIDDCVDLIFLGVHFCLLA